jgi:hypothetical protein
MGDLNRNIGHGREQLIEKNPGLLSVGCGVEQRTRSRAAIG